MSSRFEPALRLTFSIGLRSPLDPSAFLGGWIRWDRARARRRRALDSLCRTFGSFTAFMAQGEWHGASEPTLVVVVVVEVTDAAGEADVIARAEQEAFQLASSLGQEAVALETERVGFALVGREQDRAGGSSSAIGAQVVG
ncbi:hypothetical protein [Engelhardtia mirabilis]|uniref:Uncharacterized protein n=1 Tax=Engelhardtia mirabilis TaxID=2528011 RepID=A0A518BL07_9BACT|nr:hypothetical protein Pla133_27400 [Planctomycetes bacterium Pla133]QDV01978.1 hypothetical protein Pla86_27390 [Planctomycetes bacterium Pla86]